MLLIRQFLEELLLKLCFQYIERIIRRWLDPCEICQEHVVWHKTRKQKVKKYNKPNSIHIILSNECQFHLTISVTRSKTIGLIRPQVEVSLLYKGYI